MTRMSNILLCACYLAVFAVPDLRAQTIRSIPTEPRLNNQERTRLRLFVYFRRAALQFPETVRQFQSSSNEQRKAVARRLEMDINDILKYTRLVCPCPSSSNSDPIP